MKSNKKQTEIINQIQITVSQFEKIVDELEERKNQDDMYFDNKGSVIIIKEISGKLQASFSLKFTASIDTGIDL